MRSCRCWRALSGLSGRRRLERIDIFGRFRLEGRNRKVHRLWCLWCLFRAEIGAIYAEQLKELKQYETVEIANVHAVFRHVVENMVGC